MGIRNLRYGSLEDLLADVSIAEEDPSTVEYIKRLKRAKTKGAFSRREFLAMCRWKSPRSIRLCKRNSAALVENTSRRVFAARNERTRMELLTALHGVSIPTASAILTLTDPRRYGVIDIRVWQLLYKLKSVDKNPRGQGFTFDQWQEYLTILRYQAKRLKVSVRLVELTLFNVHQAHQEGTLY